MQSVTRSGMILSRKLIRPTIAINIFKSEICAKYRPAHEASLHVSLAFIWVKVWVGNTKETDTEIGDFGVSFFWHQKSLISVSEEPKLGIGLATHRKLGSKYEETDTKIKNF